MLQSSWGEVSNSDLICLFDVLVILLYAYFGNTDVLQDRASKKTYTHQKYDIHSVMVH